MATLMSSGMPIELNGHLNVSQAATVKTVTQQDSFTEKQGHQMLDPNFLVVSPYQEKEHLLDLRTLNMENKLLAKALVELRCLREDYATAPYVDSFNWSEIVDHVREEAKGSDHKFQEHSYYIVVFRSLVPPSTIAHYEDLGALDKAAHAEATQSGQFLKYWFGSPDQAGRNLATCLWRSKLDASAGSMGVAHRNAAGAARSMYTEWNIERLRLIIKDDVEGWEMLDWID